MILSIIITGACLLDVPWLVDAPLSTSCSPFPTSALGTFIVLNYLGFTLNFFTLLGMSLAIGIVVDDAIMVLENISRHFHMGKSAMQAALDGTREITFAATAATIAVMAVFLPGGAWSADLSACFSSSSA